MPPTTSPIQQPGMVPNEAGNFSGQPGTNSYWKQTLAEFMASMWANGRRQEVLDIISPSWLSAQFGEPDPSDQDGIWSPRTLLAFSRWASAYQPGMSPFIDQVLPFVAPGPNEFIETPEQTAERIAKEASDRAMEESKRQFDITTAEDKRQFDTGFAEDKRQFDLDRADKLEQDKRQAYLDYFQNELTKYGIDTGRYTANENNRLGALGQAGSLSMALQNAMDARTGKAIDLKAAGGGDYIAAEYATRALNEPQGTGNPAYQNVDSLADVIKRLIEYKPGTAPVAPVQQQQGGGLGLSTNVARVGSGALTGGNTNASGQGLHDINLDTTNKPPYVVTDTSNGLGRTIFKDYAEQPRHPAMLSQFAHGINASRERQFITGDPQVGMRANPEMVTVNNPGPRTTVDVTPLQRLAASKIRGKRAYAFGTTPDPNLQLNTFPDEVYQNQPRQKLFQGGSEKDYNKLATGFTGGAFGMKVPEAGQINYRKFSRMAEDPLALAMSAADFRSANRDLFSAVARAKVRAPLGQTVNTSLVRY